MIWGRDGDPYLKKKLPITYFRLESISVQIFRAPSQEPSELWTNEHTHRFSFIYNIALRALCRYNTADSEAGVYNFLLVF